MVKPVSLAGEYIYEERLPFGTVPWTLALADDNTYKLTVTKPNGVTYTRITLSVPLKQTIWAFRICELTERGSISPGGVLIWNRSPHR